MSQDPTREEESASEIDIQEEDHVNTALVEEESPESEQSTGSVGFHTQRTQTPENFRRALGQERRMEGLTMGPALERPVAEMQGDVPTALELTAYIN